MLKKETESDLKTENMSLLLQWSDIMVMLSVFPMLLFKFFSLFEMVFPYLYNYTNFSLG